MVRNFIAIVALFGASSTSAETTMPAMTVLVEPPTAAIKSCGLTEEGMRGAVRAAMRYNRIPVADTKIGAPMIYVVATGGQIGGGCAVSLSVKFVQFQTISLGQLSVFAEGNACTRHSLASGPNLPSTIYEKVKQGVDICTTEVLDRASTDPFG